MNFADRVETKIKTKKSNLIVGLDPNIQLIPNEFKSSYEKVEDFDTEIRIIEDYCLLVLDQIKSYAVGIKPQLAYFEEYGSKGIAVLERLIVKAKSLDLLVISDGKRGDISFTAEAYARAYLADGPLSSDALTVNPFLGSDSVEPFITQCNKADRGLFILLHTSNPSSAEIQLFGLPDKKVIDVIIEYLKPSLESSLGKNGFSNIGFVVGATKSELFSEIRAKLPNCYFLIPGIGAQGGDIEALKKIKTSGGGGGILISSSRGILFPQLKNKNTSFDPKDICREAEKTLSKIYF